MRKYFLLILLFIFSFFSVILNTNEETIITVFDDKSEEYNIYFLNTEKENITTNNLTDYFEDIKILEIYPYINPIYKKHMKKSYTFNTAVSHKKNTSNFIVEYSNQLSNYALNVDNVLVHLNGIKIDKIKVYRSNTKIDYLMQNYKIQLIKNIY